MMREPWITEPGVYPDVTDVEYLADPVVGGSLSSTGARLIANTEEGGPAKFGWQLAHPGERRRKTTDTLDFGVLAHHIVLGDITDRIEKVDAADWSKKADQQTRALARLDGRVAVLPRDMAKAEAMARAIDNHPTAAGILRSAGGQPEQTMVWRDPSTGVMCRCRVDWYRGVYADDTDPDAVRRRFIMPDLKTAESASRDAFSRAAAAYGYHQQAEFYLRAPTCLGLDDNPAFVFVVIEKDPPYLVHVMQLDHASMVLGRNLNQGALNLYAEGMRTGYWPGYGDEIDQVSLPAYYMRQYDER